MTKQRIESRWINISEPICCPTESRGSPQESQLSRGKPISDKSSGAVQTTGWERKCSHRFAQGSDAPINHKGTSSTARSFAGASAWSIPPSQRTRHMGDSSSGSGNIASWGRIFLFDQIHDISQSLFISLSTPQSLWVCGWRVDVQEDRFIPMGVQGTRDLL